MSVLPLYHRVFLALRDRIINGFYNVRVPMPSEKELCVELGVSRITVRRALELLEEEGLVERRQGARTYARALGYKASQHRRNLDLLARDASHLYLFPGEIQQNYQVVEPDKETWRQFNRQDRIGRVVRIREQRGRPYCFVVTYLPLEIADRIDWKNLGSRPVITAAIDAGYPFVKTEQVISATVADEESAKALETPLGSALLRLSGLFVDKEGNAVMRKDGYFRPESFEYRMTLYNSKQ